MKKITNLSDITKITDKDQLLYDLYRQLQKQQLLIDTLIKEDKKSKVHIKNLESQVRTLKSSVHNTDHNVNRIQAILRKPQ